MIENFSLDALNKSASSFNTEKLNWVNQQYLVSESLEKIVELVKSRLDRLELAYDSSLDFSTIVDLYRQRASTINELVDSILYCFQDFADYDQKAAQKVLKQEALEPLRQLHHQLSGLENWDAQSIHAVVEAITEALGVGMGKVGQPLRVAVTGGSFSPPIDQTVELLGKERSISRIERAIDYISANTVP